MQYPAFAEDDLQSIVQMGFGQNPNRETTLQSQSPHGKKIKSWINKVYPLILFIFKIVIVTVICLMQV